VTRLRRRIALAMTAAVLGVATLPVPALAVTPITFSIQINNSCQYGDGEPNASFVIRLIAKNGDLVERMSTTSNGSGDWSACFTNPATPGDKLRATGGGSDRTVTIPVLTLRANRVSDTVSGKWIPSTGMSVCVTHYTYLSSQVGACLPDTSDSNGSYSIDFTSQFNVDGGDYVYATYASGSDQFQLTIYVPFMVVSRAEAFVQGALNPGQVATLELQDGATNVRGTAVVQNGNYNAFSGYFRNAAGNYVRPRPGDIVDASFASDAVITIPDITGSGVAATDVVTGHCMPNRPFELFVYKPNYSDTATRYGISDGSGNFSRDFSADINLVSGDRIRVTCRYNTGDLVRRYTYVSS